MKVVLTRRGVLAAAGAFAGCLVLGGGVRALAEEGDHLRPPGGQNEAALRALCLKCDRCRSVCPQGIVVPVALEAGLMDARTPKLDLHRGYCDFCGLCQRVCPTGALAPSFDPVMERLGIAAVNPNARLAYSGVCRQCEDSCAYDALRFDELNRPFVEVALCNGCGACVDACGANVAGVYSGRERAIEVWPAKGEERL